MRLGAAEGGGACVRVVEAATPAWGHHDGGPAPPSWRARCVYIVAPRALASDDERARCFRFAARAKCLRPGCSFQGNSNPLYPAALKRGALRDWCCAACRAGKKTHAVWCQCQEAAGA